MADKAIERMTINATPERCFAVATDFERYPEWAADLKEATVVDRDDQGRPRTVAFRAAAMGHSARYRLRYEYEGAPRCLSWVLVQGDIMRRLDGEYTFEPGAEPGTTEVTYELQVELIVPIPGFVKRRAEGKIIHAALRELKRQAESGAPDHAGHPSR